MSTGITSAGLAGRIARGGVAACVSHGGGAGLTYGAQLLIARTVGADGFGIYAYVFAWMTVLARRGARLWRGDAAVRAGLPNAGGVVSAPRRDPVRGADGGGLGLRLRPGGKFGYLGLGRRAPGRPRNDDLHRPMAGSGVGGAMGPILRGAGIRRGLVGPNAGPHCPGRAAARDRGLRPWPASASPGPRRKRGAFYL